MKNPLVPRSSASDASNRHGPIIEALEHVLADIPPASSGQAEMPDKAAKAIARRAAKRAAILSGSLALPPGPLGFMTLLPDLYLIWQTQRQMVADIFGVYGRSAELTRTHMLYCLFRHAASHVLRDVAVRGSQRLVIRQLSGGALRNALGGIGLSVSQRIAGNAAGRWIPLAGAAAVGAYAYWDTLQVANTAQRLLTSRKTRFRNPHNAMCGRYELSSHPAAIALAFGLSHPPAIAPRYNIAPMQQVPIVRLTRAVTANSP